MKIEKREKSSTIKKLYKDFVKYTSTSFNLTALAINKFSTYRSF